MKKLNKRGFTIVELVIVIAVIAILAAVLIPTFSSVVNKARQSKDTQIVRNMNSAISIADSFGDINNFSDVVFELQKAGFVLGNLNPSSEGWIYVWEDDSRQMIIVDTADDSVRYNSKELANVAPCSDWFVITNQQVIADKYKDTCTTTLVADDANFVKTDSGTVSEAVIESAKDGDYVIVSGELTFEETTINKDLTFVSLDGTAKIAEDSLHIVTDSNVTFQNITFENTTSLKTDASSLYGQGASGKIVLDGCTFKDPQWEGVQITPVDGADITIQNCTFIVTENASHKHDAGKPTETTIQGCHRMLHIESGAKTTDNTKAVNSNGIALADAKVVVRNNTFIGVDLVDNAILDVDYIDYNNSEKFDAYGNVFKKADGTLITSYDDTCMYAGSNYKIFVCKTWGAPSESIYYGTNGKDVMDAQRAFELFTKIK